MIFIINFQINKVNFYILITLKKNDIRTHSITISFLYIIDLSTFYMYISIFYIESYLGNRYFSTYL